MDTLAPHFRNSSKVNITDTKVMNELLCPCILFL